MDEPFYRGAVECKKVLYPGEQARDDLAISRSRVRERVAREGRTV